jgi:hypothetical protein
MQKTRLLAHFDAHPMVQSLRKRLASRAQRQTRQNDV